MEKLIRALLGQEDGEPLPSLSPKELLILRMLVVREMYGQELVKQSEGELKRGTVYVTLQRMEEKGFVTSTQEERPQSEGGIPRRRYRIAGEGQRVLHAYERFEALAAGGKLA
jgi:PadR family transcriptional regulator PadR